MLSIGLGHYLTLAAIIFTIGVVGIFLNRKNVLLVLMSVELMLLSINFNFMITSSYIDDRFGQIFALFVLTVSAAESSIGLAILVVYYRLQGTIALEQITSLKGLPFPQISIASFLYRIASIIFLINAGKKCDSNGS